MKKVLGGKLRLKTVVSSVSAAALLVSGVQLGVSSSANAETPKTGGTLKLLMHFPSLDYLDPNRVYTGRDLQWLGGTITRTLTAYKAVPGAAGTEIVADLATNTGVPSNKAKTWKFTLRPGSTFEDGTKVTCEHLKYGASRSFATDVITDGPMYLVSWLDIPTYENGDSFYKGPYADDEFGQTYYDRAVTCSADNRTITFNLSKSVPDFNAFTTYSAIAPVQKSKDGGETYDARPQSTGPYMIKENNKTHLLLVRNPKWNKASDPIRTPYPDQQELIFGLDEEVIDQIMLNDSEKNAINFDGPLSTNKTKFFPASSDPNYASLKARTMNNVEPFVGYLPFNLLKMPCKDIRAAMVYSRNNKAILDYNGGEKFSGAYATGIISPTMGLDYAPTKILGPGSKDFLPEGNVAKALEYMNSAKTSCPEDYARATDPARGISIAVGTSSTLEDTIPINQAAWKRAGIYVKYDIIKSKYYSTVLSPKNPNDISSSGWASDWQNASTVIPELFASFGGFDMTKAEDAKDPAYPAIVAKMNKALNTLDRKAQAKLWKELDVQIAKEFWYIPTVFGKAQEVWGSGLGGVYFWQPQGTPAYRSIWIK